MTVFFSAPAPPPKTAMPEEAEVEEIAEKPLVRECEETRAKLAAKSSLAEELGLPA